MTPPPGLPRRKNSLRVKGHDYSLPGQYFVTICVANRWPAFGRVVDGQVELTPLGRDIESAWEHLPTMTSGLGLDSFVVMPNHLHAIVVLGERDPTGPAKALPELMKSFKSSTTYAMRRHIPSRDSLWQRGYHDHIVRNEKDLDRIRQYILDNPARWKDDELWVP